MRRFLPLLALSVLVPALLIAQTSERQKLVERLARDLASRDPATRVEAAEMLGRFKYAEGIEPLVFALSDREASVRRAAASALWSSSAVAQPAIPALRKALADPETSVVIRAAGALISMDVPAAQLAEPLRLVLQRGNEVDRFLAARALIGIEPAEKLAGPILDYLRRNAPDRKADVESTIARSENFEAGSKALRRLAEMQDPTMIAPLMGRLQENPILTKPILLALGELRQRPDHWIETLLGLLGASDAKIRETSVELLGKQTAAADVKIWAKPASRLVSDPQPEVRKEAIRSLMEARGFALDALAPVLQAVRADSDAENRARAAEAVGEIADATFAIDTAVKAAAAKEALPVLTAALGQDASVDVRRSALKSIDRLQLEPPAIAAILAQAAVEQKDRDLRLAALQHLRNHGRDAATAEETIRPLKTDADELIRTEADAALQSMHSDYTGTRAASTAAAVDPAARERALQTLRDYHYQFTEEAYFSSLNEVQLEIVTAFLDAGMSPNHRFGGRSYGNPALNVVLEANGGCDPKIRPTAEVTKAIVKLLLARGGNPNIADDRGNTPLMTAAEKCDPEIVKILLAAKADMNAKNATGFTAFEFGLLFTTDGAAALAAAGFRLSAEKVKAYREQFASDPKKLELLNKATKVSKK